MNFLTKNFFLFVCTLFLLTACNKENIDEVVPTEPPTFEPDTIIVNNLVNALQANSTEGLDLDCVTIEFPFELVTESDNNITINSSTDFENALNENAPNRVVSFMFPLSVINDGNAFQVSNNEVLGVAFGSCLPSSGWDVASDNGDIVPAYLFENSSCNEMVYPTELEDANGNFYTANNEEELINLMATTESLFFSLPMDVIDQDGSAMSANVTDDFYNAMYACEEIAPLALINGIQSNELDSCFTLDFPFDVLLTDSSIVTVNDENELIDLEMAGTIEVIVFPFNVTKYDGTTVTINEPQDLAPLIVECEIGITTEPSDPCNTPAHALLFFNQGQGPTSCGFLIDLPMQVEAEGTVYDIDNQQDYFDVYNMYWNQLDKIDVIYPITVTLTDGTILTFDKDQDVCDFIGQC